MNEIRFWRAVFCLLALVLILFVLVKAFTVVLPFAFGLILAYLANPLVEWFTAFGLRRDRVVLVLYLALLTLGVVLCMSLVPPLLHAANQTQAALPRYGQELDSLFSRFNSDIQKWLTPLIGAGARHFMIPAQTDDLLMKVVQKLFVNIEDLAHVGLWIIIIPFVGFFGLVQSRQWMDTLFNLTSSRYVENLLGLLAEINTTLGAYMRSVMIESLCVGFLMTLGLHFLGVNAAVLIGVTTALVNPIPFMAPVIGGALAVLLTYFQFQSLSMVLAVVVLVIVVRIIDDFILIPCVVGRSVHLHPVVMIFAVLAGVELGGFLGLIFAVPLTVVLKVVLSLLVRSRRERFLIHHEHVAT
ncbi:MAG: AI-2E family transporter [Verrucomicrobiia bacterium]